MRRRSRLLLLLVTCAVMLAAAQTAFADTKISSSGPLTDITLRDDLGCQVKHASDSTFAFYSDETSGACGTFLAFGGNTYGTQNCGACNTWQPWDTMSQTPVTGSGTSGDPYQVVTTVDVGDLRIIQTDQYVVGTESWLTRMRVENDGASPANVVLYRGMDCFLQDSDTGYGFADPSTASVGCSLQPNNDPPGRVEGLFPSAGARFYEAEYSEVWDAISSGNELPNTCRCGELIDNGMAVSWNLTIPAAVALAHSRAPGSVTVEAQTAVSPTGAFLDQAAPAVTLNSPANGSSTSDTTPTFSGNAGTAPGDSQQVRVNIYSGGSASGNPVQTLTTNRTAGTYAVDSAALALGTYTAQAEQSDSVGNTGKSSANTFTVAPAAPGAAALLPGACTNPRIGTAAADVIIGTAAGDLIRGGNGNDSINGAAGDDCVFGDRGNDRLTGGTGKDRLSGSAGRDRLSGSSGNDSLTGGASNDRLSGGSGNDRLIGGNGKDTITGGRGRNRYSGGASSDKINSANGKKETVRCGKGSDSVRADTRDRLIGCERVRRVR
jgi:hypothetical protein